MNDILKFSIAFLACGFVSSGALWSFIDAAASTKYICSESSDSHILASRALDWFQAATAIWTLYLVYLAYRRQNQGTSNALPIIGLGVYTIVHILLHISLRGHVCQHVGCVTSKSAELARTGVNIVPYISEVLGMMDLASNDQSNWPCNGRINPDYFTMPRSACPETIAEICPSSAFSAQDAPAQPYRCMIYACNDLVPGNVRRYTMSMLGLVMQLVICAYLFSVDGGNEYKLVSPNAPPKHLMAGQGSGTTAEDDGVEMTPYTTEVKPPGGGAKVPIAQDGAARVTAAAAAFPAPGIRRRTMSTSHYRPKETLQF